MERLRIRLGIATALVLGLGMGAGTASAGLVLTVEPPGAQRTSVAGVTTEYFDGFSAGWRPSPTTAVETISGEIPGVGAVPEPPSLAMAGASVPAAALASLRRAR